MKWHQFIVVYQQVHCGTYSFAQILFYIIMEAVQDTVNAQAALASIVHDYANWLWMYIYWMIVNNQAQIKYI